MKRNAAHHEAAVDNDVALPSERSTGAVFAVVCLIAAYVLSHSVWLASGCLLGAAVFSGLAWLAPGRLGPLNRAWFQFGLLLNRFVSPVVMLVLYAIAIVPFGLVLQMRADPLRRRRDGTSQTYWVPSEKGSDAPGAMTNQF